MGVIDHLPGGGSKFRTIAGPGSFKAKLKSAVKNTSTLRSLSDNQETIVKAVRKYETMIRKGHFGFNQRNSALSQIQKKSPMTSSEKIVVKKILKHLSENTTVSHAHVNRADEVELEGPHLANQPQLANRSGLSGVSSPEAGDHVLGHPMVSISQMQREHIGSGLAGQPGNNSGPSAPKSPSRPPMIPLSR